MKSAAPNHFCTFRYGGDVGLGERVNAVALNVDVPTTRSSVATMGTIVSAPLYPGQ